MWKPLVIRDIMQTLLDGQILFYSDSGCSILADQSAEWHQKISSLTAARPMDASQLDSNFTNAAWCRMDVAERLVSRPKLSAFLREGQHESGRILILSTPATRKLVAEWACLALEEPELFTDEPSAVRNHPLFIEHRHDQSILSALMFNRGWYGSTWHCVAPTRIKDYDPLQTHLHENPWIPQSQFHRT